MTGKRRAKRDGGLYQRHDHPSCPPLDAAGQRPEHRCRGRWCAQVDIGVVEGRRKRKTVYGRTEREARTRLKQVLAARDRRLLSARSATVAQWLTYWLDEVCVDERRKTNTIRTYRSRLRTHVVPVVGHMRLDRLEPEHIRAVLRRMRDGGAGDSSVRLVYSILRASLASAVVEGRIADNPAARIKTPRAVHHPRPSLTAEESLTVLAAAGDDPRWWLAVYLGMRQGECLALRWSDVDLERETLHVQRGLVRLPGGGLRFDTPKSAKGDRTIALPRRVLSRLVVLRASDPDAELVFHRPDGRPVDPRADLTAWHALLDRAGVRRVTLHAARQSAASVMEEDGVPPRMVAEILGHSRVEQTYLYQDSRDDLARQRRELEKVERRYAALGDPQPGLPAGPLQQQPVAVAGHPGARESDD